MNTGEIARRVDRFLMTDGARIPPLDGVRCAAICAVVLFHTNDFLLKYGGMPKALMSAVLFGWCGVPLFFTLSGFLIGGHVYDLMRKKTFSFGRFYASRSLRILPAAYVAMLLYGARFHKLGWDVDTLLNFLYLANWREKSLIYGHFWTLCVEEQFYLIFPPFFALLLGSGCKAGAVVVRLISFIALAWICRAGAALANADLGIPSLSLLPQADFLLLGVLAAVLHRHELMPRLARGALWLVVMLGYGFLAWVKQPIPAKVSGPNFLSFPIVFVLFRAWCFAVVFVASRERGWTLSLFSLPPFRWVAALSYSMYLYHLMIVEIMRPYLDAHVFARFPGRPLCVASGIYATLLGGTICCAAASFLFIERPFLTLRSFVLRQEPFGDQAGSRRKT